MLLGGTLEEQALVEQWTHFADTEIHLYSILLFNLFSHKVPYSKPVRGRFFQHSVQSRSCKPSFKKLHLDYLSRIERGFNTLERVLETRTFLVGERLTIADLSVATIALRAAHFYLSNSNISKFPSIVRFVETTLNQPQIAQFWTIQWPEKALAYTPPAKDTKKKEEKPKAAPAEKPKKEEKPKKKEPEPEEEEDDLVPKEEPKAKNPLDSLPKSSFNLEDWKRAYSNKDTRGPDGAIEWFYEQQVETFVDMEGTLIVPQLR